MSKPYHIHFVCHGNIFRSRLAAAYLAKVLKDPRYVISSSGIWVGDRTDLRPFSRFTRALAECHALDYELRRPHRQTSNADLRLADIIVFLNQDIFDEADERYDFDRRKALVWQIHDITPEAAKKALAIGSRRALLDATESIFEEIKAQCDWLRTYMARGSWVDVMNEKDKPTGIRLPISMVSDRGFWHRGLRVVIQTRDARFAVGKRSPTIMYAPNMLEIGVGGLIDSGESPQTAARRETHEELGLTQAARAFRPLFKYRVTSYHPHYRTRTRAHIYVYSLVIPLSHQVLQLQASEVGDAYWLSAAQIRRLLRHHRLKHFGRLAWDYKLFRLAIAASQVESGWRY